MAQPLTAQQQIDAIRAEGCRVMEYPGWRERGMWRISRGWAPQGITIHHTAGGLGSRTVSQYIRDILVSDPKVPDKCNVAIAPDGTVWMVAAGRANHMLYYSQRARDMAVAGTWPITGGSVNARGSLQNGNSWTYGVECIAAGTPNAAQREAAVRWAAALCRAHGWNGREVFGHGEASYDRGFSDPGWDMSAFRADVVRRLQSTAKPAPTPSPAATPRQQEDDMPDHHELRTTVKTDGQNWRYTDQVVKAGEKPLMIHAHATVTAPIGTDVKTRWVSWDDKKKQWVRYAVTEHASEGETATIARQAWGGADLRLDVWTDKPAEVAVVANALTWGA